jgi:hypothetical protein
MLAHIREHVIMESEHHRGIALAKVEAKAEQQKAE